MRISHVLDFKQKLFESKKRDIVHKNIMMWNKVYVTWQMFALDWVTFLF